MTNSAADILGPSGRIAARLNQYEHRDEQLEMAAAVEKAIAKRSHLLVEAGTGVGKSFAYLIPAILAAARDKDDEKRRVVVSTQTISLQEQLIDRDIPFLNAVLPVEFSAVLAKGRSNYISLRRLKGAVEKSAALFADPAESTQLQSINSWSKSTTDGSRADLDFSPLGSIWDEVQSEHGNCLGRRCPTYQDCFYYQARRRVWNADLIVVNHALFMADLVLRREDASILPNYDVVIFDEAHTLEAVAGQYLGLTVTSGQFEFLFNRLYNDRTNRGLLIAHNLLEPQHRVLGLRLAVRDFFHRLREWQEQSGSANGRIRRLVPLANEISPRMGDLAETLAEFADSLELEEERIEMTSAAERCELLGLSLSSWLKQTEEDLVYWIERFGRGGRGTRLIAAPIDVGPILREELWDRVDTAILTSATLAVADHEFNFVQSRLGLTGGDAHKFGSPFDYRKQVRLVTVEGMPDPGESPRDFESAVIECIKKYVTQTNGRAFVLFTSYRMLKSCAERLANWCLRERFTLYCQGEDLPRSLMLERFRNDDRAVLFGTDSFWQGVDVPGDALQNVVITKLPFSVPDQPLLEARVEAIRQRGGNPFMEYQLPEAIIKLKQGFGRLIRSRTDTGQVVILDPRMQTRRYGRMFLESLPKCTTVTDRFPFEE